MTVPSTGSWYFGAQADDAVRIWVDGTPVLDSWSWASGIRYGSAKALTAGTSYPIKVHYREDTGSALVRLYARLGTGGGDTLVPTTWLNTTPEYLPPGWTITGGDLDGAYSRAKVTDGSITLVSLDGATAEFKKDPGGSYAPPAWSDDTLSVTETGEIHVVDGAGYEYVFRSDGLLASVTSTTDDRKPAAIAYTYNSEQKLTRITDPVSGRYVRLRYAYETSSCTSSPPAGFVAPNLGDLCAIIYPDSTQTDLLYVATSGPSVIGRVQNPGGEITDFGYTSGVLTSIRDSVAADAVAAGQRTNDSSVLWQVSYDTSTRVSSLTAPAATTGAARGGRTFTYLASLTRVEVTGGASGVDRSATTDAAGRSVTERDAAGNVTRTEWDTTKDRIRWTETPGTAEPFRTGYVYDTQGRQTITYGPAPQSWFTDELPSSAHSTDMPRSAKTYDQNIPGLAATWWDNATLGGVPVSHYTGIAEQPSGSLDRNWGTGVPAQSYVTNADGFSGRFTGWITFPAIGAYQLKLWRNAKVRIWIDDVLKSDAWTEAEAFAPTVTVTTTKANEAHRIRIEIAETGGPSNHFSLHAYWVPPGGAQTIIPGSAFTPAYGLETAAATSDGSSGSTVVEQSTTTYAVPHLGLPTAVTEGAGTAALTSQTGYEAESASGSYLRRLWRQLPSGVNSRVNYEYWADNAIADNPCTTTTEVHHQAGMLSKTTDADPDGTGPVKAIVREARYDELGRTVATRTTGNDGTVGGWECSNYDSRGRVTSTMDRDGKTTTTSYATPGVITTSYTDSSGVARSTRTETDLLGRTVAYVDELGTRSEYTFDQAGRPVDTYRTYSGGARTLIGRNTYSADGRLSGVEDRTTGTVRTTTVTYDSAGRVATTTLPNGVVSTSTYDSVNGLETGVSHARSGSTLASSTVTRARSGRINADAFSDQTGRSLSRTYTFDEAGRLTRTVDSGTVSTATRRYAYDANSNRCANASTCSTVTFGHDRADRLTFSPEWTSTSFDRWGNLTAGVPVDSTGDPGTFADASRNFGYGDSPTSVPFTVSDTGTFTTKLAVTASATSSKTDTTSVPLGVTRTFTQASSGSDELVGHVEWDLGNPSRGSLTLRWKDPSGIVRSTVTGTAGTLETRTQSTAPGTWTFEVLNPTPSVSVVSAAVTRTRINLVNQHDSGDVPLPTQSVSHAVHVDEPGLITTTLRPSKLVGPLPEMKLEILGPTGAVLASKTGTAAALTVSTVGTVVNALYTVRITTNLPGALTYTLDTARPVANGSVTTTLLNSSGQDVPLSHSGENPDTMTAAVTPGDYTLRYTTSGSGSWVRSGTSFPGPPNQFAVAYDANDHATSINNGETTTLEAVDPSGRTIERWVTRNANGSLLDHVRYGYGGDGDSPIYVLSDTAVTSFGPFGAVHTATVSSWQLATVHGDVVAETGLDGTMTVVPLTDEYGVVFGTANTGTGPEDRLGWLGEHKRFTLDARTQVIRMGARLYHPGTGAFLQVDPIEGGSCNDYDYACADPVNQLDLAGTCKTKKTRGFSWRRIRNAVCRVTSVAGRAWRGVCRNRAVRTVSGTLSVTDVLGAAFNISFSAGKFYIYKLGIGRSAQLAASFTGRVVKGLGAATLVATVFEGACRTSGFPSRQMFYR